MLFVFSRPDPNEIAQKSKSFWEQQVKIEEDRLRVAQDTYDRAISRFDDDATNWDYSNELARAEDNLADAKDRHSAALKKLNWENGRHWQGRSATRAATKFFRRNLKSIDWTHIFKPRKDLSNGPE
jgi:hypothetical protein